MRLSYPFSVGLLARVGVAGTLGLGGCTAKTCVEPEVPCGTSATVRLCHGKTLMCPTEHTTLELPDGTRLHPTGPLWAAYQPHQTDGATLRIGYRLSGAPVPAGSPGSGSADISCLEAPEANCTIPRVD